jgi:hypothetical protein
VSKIVNAQYKYISSAVGGPCPWTGRTLVEVHTGMNISKEEFDRFV